MALNVLIVDDSATVRAVITKTLELAGAEVNELFQAENGKIALEILGDNWIDLVFADINMPVMGGVEMIDKMSEDGLLKTVPVIIVSTEGSKTRIRELTEKGISAYLRKPFSPEELKEVLDRVLGVQDGN